MTFKVAKREAVPLLIGLSGTSGSGKTYSALMLAAGLAGENGKIGFIDTEAGRGSMYSDDLDIVSAMPGGQYFVEQMAEPFSPRRYSDLIKNAISEKFNVLVIDSMSHEWEGFGGCQDIAENNKLRGMPNWAMAKMEHKKLMNMLTQSPLHIIFCLRAREKTKPVKNKEGKIEMVEAGMQAIQEKNFMYEMTLSMMFTEQSPGVPRLTKCPKPLLHLFPNESLVTKKTGEKLLSWSKSGQAIDIDLRELKRKCREAAGFGNDTLNMFFNTISIEEKNVMKAQDQAFKEEMRSIADEADRVKHDQVDQEEQEKDTAKINFNNKGE